MLFYFEKIACTERSRSVLFLHFPFQQLCSINIYTMKITNPKLVFICFCIIITGWDLEMQKLILLLPKNDLISFCATLTGWVVFYFIASFFLELMEKDE